MPFHVILHHGLLRAFHLIGENIRDVRLDDDRIRHDGLLAILAGQREIRPAVAAMLRDDLRPDAPADGNAVRPYLLPISVLNDVFLPEDSQTDDAYDYRNTLTHVLTPIL